MSHRHSYATATSRLSHSHFVFTYVTGRDVERSTETRHIHKPRNGRSTSDPACPQHNTDQDCIAQCDAHPFVTRVSHHSQAALRIACVSICSAPAHVQAACTVLRMARPIANPMINPIVNPIVDTIIIPIVNPIASPIINITQRTDALAAALPQ